ncbi:SMI1/KNR4 family protein [Archangium gephyra]|uniref:SMI1/KNR4 family protein n=1 Tax=Archangium gephyra TaxID=48 RepID=UPI003B81700A
MTDWYTSLRQAGITVLGAPTRLPVEEDLARTEARLKARLPESYRRFCTELGPGRFGDLLEIWVPWHAKGFFDSPRDIRDRLTSLVDASDGKRQAVTQKALQIGYVVLGAPPIPRLINNLSAELFLLPSEPTEGDECTLYALDHRTSGAPPRLVKLARSFTSLLLEGFAGKRLARLPFVAAPGPDQFALEYHPRELPAP